MSAPSVAIGIMSGTSGDGVDAVMLEFESVEQRHEPRLLGHAFIPFEAALQAELRDPGSLPLARISELHAELPRRYADAVRELDGWERCQVVGMHGQTVWHGPPSATGLTHTIPNTLQIGSSVVLAEALAKPVVGELRAADMFHGGEGAPIIPFTHWFFTPPERAGRLVVNIGGIANITHVTAKVEDVVGYDIGPGMMIADHLAQVFSSGDLDYDRDGVLSRGGRVVEDIVAYVLAHPFFQTPPPRSTGREDFGVGYATRLLERFSAVPDRDLLCSVLAVTARAIIRACAECEGVREVLMTGGGAKNPTLIRLTREGLAVPVERATAGVFAASCHEPAGIALIAARSFVGLTSSLPRVTGARRACVLGHVAYPSGVPR